MNDLSSPHSDRRNSNSYDPHRSSMRLEGRISMEMLSRFEPYLRRLAGRQWRRSLAAKESVSDIVQETLAVAVRDFGAFDGTTEGELAAWMRRIVLRVMQTKLRKYKTQKADVSREVSHTPSELSSPEPPPSEILNQIEQRLRLEIALQELPAHYRQVIELREIEDMAFAGIGELIGKSAEAARKLHTRGILMLQQRMGEIPRLPAVN